MKNSLVKICKKVNKINDINSNHIKNEFTTFFPSIAPTNYEQGTPEWAAAVQRGATILSIDQSFLHTLVRGIILSLM